MVVGYLHSVRLVLLEVRLLLFVVVTAAVVRTVLVSSSSLSGWNGIQTRPQQKLETKHNDYVLDSYERVSTTVQYSRELVVLVL